MYLFEVDPKYLLLLIYVPLNPGKLTLPSSCGFLLPFLLLLLVLPQMGWSWQQSISLRPFCVCFPLTCLALSFVLLLLHIKHFAPLKANSHERDGVPTLPTSCALTYRFAKALDCYIPTWITLWDRAATEHWQHRHGSLWKWFFKAAFRHNTTQSRQSCMC